MLLRLLLPSELLLVTPQQQTSELETLLYSSSRYAELERLGLQSHRAAPEQTQLNYHRDSSRLAELLAARLRRLLSENPQLADPAFPWQESYRFLPEWGTLEFMLTNIAPEGVQASNPFAEYLQPARAHTKRGRKICCFSGMCVNWGYHVDAGTDALAQRKATQRPT